MNAKTLRAMILGSLLSSMIAAPALARDVIVECQASSDCSEGYVCEEFGGYDCPALPPCMEGDEECEARMGEMEGCTSETYAMCVPAPPEACDPTAGAEACGDGLQCVTFSFESCSGGGSAPPCAPDEECPELGEIEEGSCETQTESYCVPPYFAPCQEAADCGPGFSCEQREVCYGTCSGGAAPCSVDEDGTVSCEEPAEPEGDCMETCELEEEKSCKLLEIPCDEDGLCPEGLECFTFEDGDAPVLCEMTDDGQTNCLAPEPSEPISLCAPPNWERWIGGGGYPGGGFGNQEDNSGGTTRPGGETPQPETPDQPNDGGGNNDVGGQPQPQPTPGENGGGGGQANQDGGELGGGGAACQVAPGQSSSPAGLGLLAALGLMLGLRRRRRQG